MSRAAIAVSLILLAGLAARPVVAGTTIRVSVGPGGVQAPSGSFNSLEGLSADGRFVEFFSDAAELVAADRNGVGDVFLRDLARSETYLVSTANGRTQGDAASFGNGITPTGRFVLFSSEATNLVPSDTNGKSDVFVRDRVKLTTKRVSVGRQGRQAFRPSEGLDISADGRRVVFNSLASFLAPGDTNGFIDVFVDDSRTRKTQRVNVSTAGTQANSYSGDNAVISADGRIVVFTSDADNLVPGTVGKRSRVYVRDLETGITTLASCGKNCVPDNRPSYGASVSADGRYVAFESFADNLVPGDTNDNDDVFVRDRVKGVTSRISIGIDGAEPNGFGSGEASISADGRFVAFTSGASNLVQGDTNNKGDVFLVDRATGTTERVSLTSAGIQGNARSSQAYVSADGRTIAFESEADNLVPGDTNRSVDVFVRRR